ncbi:cellulose binding domain-containing protein [Streptomyces sp. JNUCC 64]
MPRSRSRSSASLLAIVLGALALVAAVLAPPASAAPPSLSPAHVTATFGRVSTWDNGYEGTYTIRNHGRTAIEGWSVAFSLPADTAVATSWHSRLTRENGGRHVFEDAGWNSTLAPGASVSFGWVSVGTGRPRACVLNRLGPCEYETDFTPPTVPTGVTASSVDDTSLQLDWLPSYDDRSPVVAYQISVNGGPPLAPSTPPPTASPG